jgi:outer membrane protein assembly factor BamE (lipoprotein component of BamABCDE complex)
MNKILSAAVVGLTTLLVVNGCSNKEAEMRLEQVSSQVTAQTDSLRVLRAELTAKSDSLKVVMQLGDNANEKIQSLTDQNQKASRNIAALSRKTEEQDKKYQDLQQSSKYEVFRRDSLLAEINTVFSDTNITLVEVRQELGNEKVMSRVKSDFIENVKPWYAKWKHDATKRNFLQVLFASNKAKKPAHPEPSFDSLRMTLDSLSAPQKTPPDTTEIKAISMTTVN